MDIGQTAPDFTLPTADAADGNNEVTLSSLRGSIVVLFFYPKDMTPGCTTEATAFSALKKDFDALNVKIIGISKDSIVRHGKFIAKLMYISIVSRLVLNILTGDIVKKFVAYQFIDDRIRIRQRGS